MASGRKIEDEREAVRCLRAAERAGLSAGEWGRAHGIDGRSLRAWKTDEELFAYAACAIAIVIMMK